MIKGQKKRPIISGLLRTSRRRETVASCCFKWTPVYTQFGGL